MATATGRHLNWSGMAFTPTGGSSTPMTSIVDCQIDDQGRIIGTSGDANNRPIIKTPVFSDPMVTLTYEDQRLAVTFPFGTKGSWTGTHNDGANVATTGAVVYVLSNAVIGNHTRGGAHQQFGRGTVRIESYSADGTTNPLSSTPAT
jgi:hypothetical protein